MPSPRTSHALMTLANVMIAIAAATPIPRRNLRTRALDTTRLRPDQDADYRANQCGPRVCEDQDDYRRPDDELGGAAARVAAEPEYDRQSERNRRVVRYLRNRDYPEPPESLPEPMARPGATTSPRSTVPSITESDVKWQRTSEGLVGPTRAKAARGRRRTQRAGKYDIPYQNAGVACMR